ncbi:MAG: OmpA family protein [Alphaproteobacteria bacterium]|nr:OmpA family protein [Alphaproteobacteria bacterium]
MTHRIRTLIVSVPLALFVAGCGWSKIDTMKDMKPTGSKFYKALYSEYVKVGDREAKEDDWNNAVKFADRAIKSASGGPVYPEAIEARDLPKNTVGDLLAARNRLTAALIRSGRKKAPKDAAHAQVMFDCWMEEQEEDHQPKDIAKCRAAFEKSLAKVEKSLKKKKKKKKKRKAKAMPAPKPAPKPEKASFIVYFDFDGAKITAKGQAVIGQALSWSKARGPGEISVTGHTDRAGANSYNSRLSERRAEAVADALIDGGVYVGLLFKTGASGETAPAVATADGKREARNRRVEIKLLQLPR